MARSITHLVRTAMLAAILVGTLAGLPSAAAAKSANKPKPDLVIANVCRIGDGSPSPSRPDDPNYRAHGHVVVTVANVGHGRAQGAEPFNVGIFTKYRSLAQTFVASLNPNGQIVLDFPDVDFGPTGTGPLSAAWKVQVDLAYFLDGAWSFPNRVAEVDDGSSSNQFTFGPYANLPLCAG
jgi:hypothetical protein